MSSPSHGSAQERAGHGAENQLSALRTDLRRYGARPFLREPSVWAVAVYRLGRWNDERRSSAVGRRVGSLAYLLSFMMVRLSTGIEIPKEAAIGPGLRIHHLGPIVVHPRVVVGSRCTLRHGVTLGERKRGGGVPSIGDDVEFGAYAQVLGPVEIGSDTSVGALCLVIRDIPTGSTVMAPTGSVRPCADTERTARATSSTDSGGTGRRS